MSDERTRAEGYSAVNAKSKRRRRLPSSHGEDIPELDRKLRAKRAARRAGRLARGKARRPLGRRPASKEVVAVRKGSRHPRRKRKRQRSLTERGGLSRVGFERPTPEPDPRFDSARLTIELVPRPLWWKSNIRSIVPKEDWDLLRRAVYRRARYLCEICGGRGPDHPIECHEVWRYDESARTQVLVRLIGLCPACHGVKHMGRSQVVGKGDQALAHLAKVNEWPAELAQSYVDLAFHVWGRRSKLKGWKLIVDWDAIGIEYGVRLSLSGEAQYFAKPDGEHSESPRPLEAPSGQISPAGTPNTPPARGDGPAER